MMKKKILIIEDNPEVRENLAEILELDGYEAITAENGKIGVEMAMQHRPELIICDVMMPVLDGFGVLKILNRNPDLMHTPFMFLTAKAEKTDFRKGMGLGADDYLTKPFDDVELMSAIEMRLTKSHQPINNSNSPSSEKHFLDPQKAIREFEELSQGKEIRRYVNKSVLYEEGQYPKWIYKVETGLIKSYQINDFGKELILDIFGPGDLFGYISVFTDGKYFTYTAAMEDSRVAIIPIEEFKQLILNSSDFSVHLNKLIAHHYQDIERTTIEHAYSSVRKKVANALLMVKKKSNSNEIRLRREELASLAGTAKETVIRTLSNFKSENLIEIDEGVITIIDEVGLEAMPQ